MAWKKQAESKVTWLGCTELAAGLRGELGGWRADLGEGAGSCNGRVLGRVPWGCPERAVVGQGKEQPKEEHHPCLYQLLAGRAWQMVVPSPAALEGGGRRGRTLGRD